MGVLVDDGDDDEDDDDDDCDDGGNDVALLQVLYDEVDDGWRPIPEKTGHPDPRDNTITTTPMTATLLLLMMTVARYIRFECSYLAASQFRLLVPADR